MFFCLLISCQPATSNDSRRKQVELTVIGQQKVENESEIPWADRRIMFRMVNNSSKPVILPGSNTSDGFFPTGYLVRFDKRKKEWLTPSGSSSHLTFNEIAETQTDRYVLDPGKALNFYDTGESIHVGERFKKVVYIFVGKESGKPQIIQSETFILQ
jgi:hypothetical protein